MYLEYGRKKIRSYLGWGNSGGSPTMLTDPNTGQQTNSPKNMANIQNQFYADKVSKIRQKLPKIGDPTKTLRDMMNKRPHPRQQGLTLKAVSPSVINNIIRQLKISKSSGLDNLDTYIIKLIRPYIVPVVTHIVNTSISTHHYTGVGWMFTMNKATKTPLGV